MDNSNALDVFDAGTTSSAGAGNLQIDELGMHAARLIERALSATAVAKLNFDDGLSLFAYPAELTVLFGVGYRRDALLPATIENVLTRRLQAPQDFAAWLPAEFADGSFFVLRRLERDHDRGVHPPLPHELGHALALLTP